MKSVLFGIIFSAAILYAQAQEDAKPKDGEVKIYKRLIPADVLRGKLSIRITSENLISFLSVNHNCESQERLLSASPLGDNDLAS